MTTGGGTSATPSQLAPSWSRRRSKTATCCCPRGRCAMTAHRGRTARCVARPPAPGRCGRRVTCHGAVQGPPAADGAGPGQGGGVAAGPQPAGAGRTAGGRRRGLGLISPAEPLWWNVAWRIGVRAAHPRPWPCWSPRSWPPGGPAGTAWLTCTQLPGHGRHPHPRPLAGLAGAAPASLLLIGAAAAVVQVRGAIGTRASRCWRRAAAGDRRGSGRDRDRHAFPASAGRSARRLVLLLSSGTSHTAIGSGHLAAPVGVDARRSWAGCPARWPDIRPPARTCWNWPASPSWPG